MRAIGATCLAVCGWVLMLGCSGAAPKSEARRPATDERPAAAKETPPETPATVPAVEQPVPVAHAAPAEKPAAIAKSPSPPPWQEWLPDKVPEKPARSPSVTSRPRGGGDGAVVVSAAQDPPPAADVGRGSPDPADVGRGSPDPAGNDQSNQTAVQVFYGTDRAAIAAEQLGRSTARGWLSATVAAAGGAMLLCAAGFRYWPSRWTRGLARCGIGTTVGMGLITGYVGWQDLGSRPRPESAMVVYGAQRGELALGKCVVTIPKDHRVGRVEGPSILRLEFREDPEHHVVLTEVEPLATDEFYADLKACVGRSKRKEAMVFIHGFNVTFEDAVRRTAQIAYDLKFSGAPICYSWPSQGELWKYPVDETNVEWTVPHLKQFLADVARQSGASQVYLLGHSMGNRALTAALRYLAYEVAETRPVFREVVLTAPDIDADVFRRDIVPAIAKTAQRVTLYASSNDEALVLSKRFHGYPRAGDSGGNLVVLSGVDTIDVSAVDTSFVGHSYYGSSNSVLADLFDLLAAGKPPDERKWLRPEALGQLRYWIFHRG